MIQTKQDLEHYLACDKAALGITKKHPKPFRDEVWQYERALRYAEYYNNMNGGGYFIENQKIVPQ